MLGAVGGYSTRENAWASTVIQHKHIIANSIVMVGFNWHHLKLPEKIITMQNYLDQIVLQTCLGGGVSLSLYWYGKTQPKSQWYFPWVWVLKCVKVEKAMKQVCMYAFNSLLLIVDVMWFVASNVCLCTSPELCTKPWKCFLK